MKKYKEFTESLFEMANVIKSRTGLNTMIWISTKEPSHGPRIKVQANRSDKIISHEMFIVTIEDMPEVIGDIGKLKAKDINKIKEFVILNKEVLLDYWNEKELDIIKIIERLKKV